MKKLLAERDVTLLSAGLDEVPGVYKDIETVMAAQSDLVDILGPVGSEAGEDVPERGTRGGLTSCGGLTSRGQLAAVVFVIDTPNRAGVRPRW